MTTIPTVLDNASEISACVNDVETSTSVSDPIDAEEQIWRESRKMDVGGSEVGDLFPSLNLEDPSDPGSRYGCPRRLSYEKLDVSPDYEHTPQTLRLFERGHLIEPFAADDYAKQTGHRVVRTNKRWKSPTYPHMACYADRLAYPADGTKITLECKSINEHAAARLESEGLSIDYALQLQQNMECTQTEIGQFSLKIVPDYLDAVIEQIPKRKLRSEILNYLAPDFECIVTPPTVRDGALIQMAGEKIGQFWSLIEQKKLADPLPDINDQRCKGCQFRKTCRGTAFAEANAAIPTRDKKGVQYASIENPEFVQIVTDRLQIMKNLDEQEELIKAIDTELKQNWPQDTGAVQVPGTGIKIRWNFQRGAQRWDAEALNADSKTIGRKIAFADWAASEMPNALATFTQAHKEVSTLADKYKAQSAPTRPFVFSLKGA